MPREPLVLIPPMLCDAEVFAPQIAALSHDHAVMTAPAHHADRMEKIAADILRWAPAKCALAGMGMGGMVAMELVRQSGGRFTRLALIATGAQAGTPESAAAREAQIAAARADRMEDVLRHEINATWMAPCTDRVALVSQLLAMGARFGPDDYVRQARALQRRRDQQKVLRKLTQPTAIICGRHDGQHPVKRQEFLAELIPFAALEVIEEAGYLPTLEAPEATTAALRRWMRQPLILRR